MENGSQDLPSPATCELKNLGKWAHPICASISSSVKWVVVIATETAPHRANTIQRDHAGKVLSPGLAHSKCSINIMEKGSANTVKSKSVLQTAVIMNKGAETRTTQGRAGMRVKWKGVFPVSALGTRERPQGSFEKSVPSGRRILGCSLGGTQIHSGRALARSSPNPSPPRSGCPAERAPAEEPDPPGSECPLYTSLAHSLGGDLGLTQGPQGAHHHPTGHPCHRPGSWVPLTLP